MKSAAYVTTNKSNTHSSRVREVLQYCNEQDIDLKIMLQVTADSVLFRPENIVKDVLSRNCEMILTDDRFFLLCESIGLENTLVRQCENEGIEYIFTEVDMKMSDLVERMRMGRTKELCQMDSNIGAIAIYQRSHHDTENMGLEEMREYIKSYLNDGEAHGVMIYENEETDMFQSLKQLWASNSIHTIIMKEPFMSLEGKQFIEEAKQLEIKCLYYENLVQIQGQNLL